MTQFAQRLLRAYTLLLTIAILLTPALVIADPLDDLGAKLTSFMTRAGTIATALVLPAGGLTITALAVKRKMAKTMGDDDAMHRSGNQIVDAIKLTAIAGGAGLLTAIAGSILQ